MIPMMLLIPVLIGGCCLLYTTRRKKFWSCFRRRKNTVTYTQRIPLQVSGITIRLCSFNCKVQSKYQMRPAQGIKSFSGEQTLNLSVMRIVDKASQREPKKPSTKLMNTTFQAVQIDVITKELSGSHAHMYSVSCFIIQVNKLLLDYTLQNYELLRTHITSFIQQLIFTLHFVILELKLNTLNSFY